MSFVFSLLFFPPDMCLPTCPPSLLSQPATMRWADSSSLYLYEMFLTRVAAEQTFGSSPISILTQEDTEYKKVPYIYYIQCRFTHLVYIWYIFTFFNFKLSKHLPAFLFIIPLKLLACFYFRQDEKPSVAILTWLGTPLLLTWLYFCMSLLMHFKLKEQWLAVLM